MLATVALIGVGLLLLGAAPVSADDDLEACLARNLPTTDDVRIISATRRSASGESTELRLRSLGRRRADEQRVLVQFLAPEELRDAELLILDLEPGRRPVFWAYSPGLDSPRELKGPDVADQLLGTDFGWEELMLARGALGWEGATRLPDETLDGRPVLVLELRPPPEHSHYGRILARVDRELCVALELDLFGHDGKPRRVLRVDPTSVEHIGTYRVARELHIRDLDRKTESTVRIETVVSGLEIPDLLLDPKGLGHVRPDLDLDANGQPIRVRVQTLGDDDAVPGDKEP